MSNKTLDCISLPGTAEAGKRDGPAHADDAAVENALLRGALWLTARALRNYQQSPRKEIDVDGQPTLEVIIPRSFCDKADDALARRRDVTQQWTRQMTRKPKWQRHQKDEDGEHDPEECYACLLEKEVTGDCRCADCCKRLLIEVSVEDAEREPLIAQKGSPIYADPRLTASGKPELEGYILNRRKGKDISCVFLNAKTDLCTIYDTRPLTCRLFDCDGEQRDRMIELGILPAKREGRGRGG